MGAFSLILSTYGIYIVGFIVLLGIVLCICKLSSNTRNNNISCKKYSNTNKNIVTNDILREIKLQQIKVIDEYLDITFTLKNYLEKNKFLNNTRLEETP